jgi:nucleotide-binding universal stress UspA family protein
MSDTTEERRAVAGAGGSTGERRVVVGVDGSQPSRHALQWARFMARVLDARIDAVTVWDISAVMASAWVDDWDPEKDAAANLQATLAEVLGSRPTTPVREIVRHGSAAAELVQASQGAQLLILGRRGHGGFHGLLLGSVSAACTAHAGCPVLIVHGDTPPPPSWEWTARSRGESTGERGSGST